MNESHRGDHLNDKPCASGLSRKRKQPDSDEPENVLEREGPLTNSPIDNEYEHYDDADDDEQGPSINPIETALFKEVKRAQEATTIDKYGDMGFKVTPFNLEEEVEEGEFDGAGNFKFRKKDDSDTWAESVNWAEVERQEDKRESNKPDITMEETQAKPTVIKRDKASVYTEMLRLMRPDENVKKTIQRLGNSIPKRKPAKSGTQQDSSDAAKQAADIKEIRRKLDLMIELAHGRLEDGEVDIYQKSYENLEDAIN